MQLFSDKTEKYTNASVATPKAEDSGCLKTSLKPEKLKVVPYPKPTGIDSVRSSQPTSAKGTNYNILLQ